MALRRAIVRILGVVPDDPQAPVHTTIPPVLQVNVESTIVRPGDVVEFRVRARVHSVVPGPPLPQVPS